MRVRYIKVLLLAPEQKAILSVDPPMAPDEQPVAINLSLLRSSAGSVFIDRASPDSLTVRNTTPIPAVVAIAIVSTRLSPTALTWAQHFLERLTKEPTP
jgi:hypothetical protein